MGDLAPSIRDLLSSEVEALRTAAPVRGRPGDRGGEASRSDLDPSSLLRLVELGRRLAAETDPDEVLRIVLHEAIEIASAERGFLVLVRGEDYEFTLAENLDRSEVEQPAFEVSRTLIRRATGEGRPVVLHWEDHAGPGSPSESLREIGVRSVACVPIVHETAKLGVLYLDSRNRDHAFTSGTARLLELFAAQAGAALENARAHHAKARALETAAETIRRQRSDIEKRSRYHTLIGGSEPMQEVYRKLDLFAPTELPVLILGETGTGKELVAHLIHSGGPRSKGPFVATNCAGLSESLLEAELFGHERGAFTGADRSRPGLFELAHRGTLFLDEVGDMGLRMQADLLRVLQSGELRRVGGRETIRVDVRIIAATHRDLEERIRLGEFRQDLYFRLNVLSLGLPALREHAADIPLLAEELMKRFVPPGAEPPRISERAMRRLVAHPWPGNVRELENVLRRLLVLDVAGIEEKHLPPELSGRGVASLRPGTLRKVEERAVRAAMEEARGNKAEAARILGVDRTTLYAKLRRFRLLKPER